MLPRKERGQKGVINIAEKRKEMEGKQKAWELCPQHEISEEKEGPGWKRVIKMGKDEGGCGKVPLECET